MSGCAGSTAVPSTPATTSATAACTSAAACFLALSGTADPPLSARILAPTDPADLALPLAVLAAAGAPIDAGGDAKAACSENSGKMWVAPAMSLGQSNGDATRWARQVAGAADRVATRAAIPFSGYTTPNPVQVQAECHTKTGSVCTCSTHVAQVSGHTDDHDVGLPQTTWTPKLWCAMTPDLMMRGSRLWVTAMPLPAHAPHCMLTAAQPDRQTALFIAILHTHTDDAMLPQGIQSTCME